MSSTRTTFENLRRFPAAPEMLVEIRFTHGEVDVMAQALSGISRSTGWSQDDVAAAKSALGKLRANLSEALGTPLNVRWSFFLSLVVVALVIWVRHGQESLRHPVILAAETGRSAQSQFVAVSDFSNRVEPDFLFTNALELLKIDGIKGKGARPIDAWRQGNDAGRVRWRFERPFHGEIGKGEQLTSKAQDLGNTSTAVVNLQGACVADWFSTQKSIDARKLDVPDFELWSQGISQKPRLTVQGNPLHEGDDGQRDGGYGKHKSEECEHGGTGGIDRVGKRVILLAICSFGFVPVIGLGLKLINDGYMRLALWVFGAYLSLLGGCIWLVALSVFRWTWGWWL